MSSRFLWPVRRFRFAAQFLIGVVIASVEGCVGAHPTQHPNPTEVGAPAEMRPPSPAGPALFQRPLPAGGATRVWSENRHAEFRISVGEIAAGDDEQHPGATYDPLDYDDEASDYPAGEDR